MAGKKREKADVIWLGNGSRASVPETAARLLPELKRRVRIVAEDFTGQKDMSAVTPSGAVFPTSTRGPRKPVRSTSGTRSV